MPFIVRKAKYWLKEGPHYHIMSTSSIIILAERRASLSHNVYITHPLYWLKEGPHYHIMSTSPIHYIG